MQNRFTVGPGLGMTPEVLATDKLQLSPMSGAQSWGLLPPPGVSPPAAAPPSPPAPAPIPTSPPAPVVVPQAPGSNPFDHLPFPSPGERIKADDFKALSQALKIIADMAALTANLFGHTFGEVKLAVTTQGYQIARVMSVFGAEIAHLDDPSLDSRKVIQVLPVALGNRAVILVVTEAVDTRRFAPNLIGLAYPEAQDRIRSIVGDVSQTGPPPNTVSLVGLTLGQAQNAIQGSK